MSVIIVLGAVTFVAAGVAMAVFAHAWSFAVSRTRASGTINTTATTTNDSFTRAHLPIANSDNAVSSAHGSEVVNQDLRHIQSCCMHVPSQRGLHTHTMCAPRCSSANLVKINKMGLWVLQALQNSGNNLAVHVR